MIKLIACDLDGTALDSSKKLDSGLKKLYPKLKEQGMELTFVSGRNEELLERYIDELDISLPYVTNNGGNIYQEHVCRFNDYIPGEYNDVLTRMLEKQGIPFRLFADEGAYGFKSTAFFKERMGLFKNVGLKSYRKELELKDLHIYKVTCDFTGQEEKIEGFLEEVKKNCPHMNFLKAETNVYCANSLTANKGDALEKVCEMIGITMEEVMAFGDNGNDVPMLEKAKIAVAMDNSPEEVKALCDHVCKDNDHHGVSAFLKDYFKL